MERLSLFIQTFSRARGVIVNKFRKKWHIQ